MNALDRVRKAHVAIMGHKKWCAYSALLACGKVSIDEETRTAYTDGWNVVYGRKFIEELPEREVRGVVLHESTHKAYRHLHIYKDLWEEDSRLANIAMDHFVNLSLMDTDGGENFIAIPKVGIQPEPKYRGWSTKQIFDDLKKNPPPQPPQPPGGEDSDEPGEPGDNPGDNPSDNPGKRPGRGGGGMDEHDWENAAKGDPKQQQEQAEEIERALRQGEILRRKMQGKGAGNSNGVFDDLLRPKLNWRALLRQFLTATCSAVGESSWSVPNRRMLAGDDLYMPGDVGKTARHLVVVFDTSGSCFHSDEMTAFVSEMVSITKTVKPKRITVLYVDDGIRGVQEFRNGQIAVQSIVPKGGGGTDLTHGFAWCTENRVRPDAMIFLTDGYTPFGEPPGYPTLWAITTDIIAPFGTTINIKL